jgi:hypothetical protein
LSQEIISDDDVDTDIIVEHTNGKELSDQPVPDEQKSMVWSFTKTFKTKLIIWVWTILFSFSFFLSICIYMCVCINSLSLSLFLYKVSGILAGELRRLSTVKYGFLMCVCVCWGGGGKLKYLDFNKKIYQD